MKSYRVMIAMLLVGGSACSMQPDSNSQGSGAAVVAAAVTAPGASSNASPRAHAQGRGASAGAPALGKSASVSASSSGAIASQGAPSSGTPAGAPTQAAAAPASAQIVAPPTVATPPATQAAGFSTAAQAATASMGTLANVVGSDSSTNRGFSSAGEVNSSTLADGLPVQFVRLDSLAGFTAGQDTKALAFDKQEVLFPITVAGNVRSSVTVQKGPNGQWQAIKFGNAAVAKGSHSARLTVTSKRPVDAGSVSLIEIPTVHAFLLSHTEKGVHMVTPVRDIPGTSYTAGVTAPAAEVFAALQPLAAGVNHSVPN